MLISMIIAQDVCGFVGKGGGLPWQLPGDLRFFRKITMGKPCIMGRKTFETLPKRLDGRDSIVIASKFNTDEVLDKFDELNYKDTDHVVNDITQALMIAFHKAKKRQVKEIMVIGGPSIWEQFMPYVGRVYFTDVRSSLGGDIKFDPDLKFLQSFQMLKASNLKHGKNDEVHYRHIVYQHKDLNNFSEENF